VIDPNNKLECCEFGLQREREFVGTMFKHGVTAAFNPQKSYNKYATDLVVTLPADLKYQHTPFFLSEELYGIPSATAVTLNVEPFLQYEKESPNALIVFEVMYPNYKATHYAHLREIRRAIDRGLAKEHVYKERPEGNQKRSFVLNAAWFPEFQKAWSGENK
jgi:hypothetical protein